jgi:soluble lytic murein transglycosylase-like protein
MRWFESYRRAGIIGIAILAVASLPCFAAELAVLKNGFSIRHEQREVIGAVTRLYTKADRSSYVDVPTSQIDHFEAAPEVPASNQKPSGAGQLRNAPPFGKSLNYGANALTARPAANLDELVNATSQRYRLDPDLVNSVIKAESGFNVRAVSPKGAQGLMQLMPGTASELGVRNAFDPQANVEGGTRYLRALLERYNFDLVKALAAYNAGPERVEQFGGVPPFYETRAYVRRIVVDFNKKKVAQEKAASAKSPSKGAASKAAATGAGRAAQAKTKVGASQ